MEIPVPWFYNEIVENYNQERVALEQNISFEILRKPFENFLCLTRRPAQKNKTAKLVTYFQFKVSRFL